MAGHPRCDAPPPPPPIAGWVQQGVHQGHIIYERQEWEGVPEVILPPENPLT